MWKNFIKLMIVGILIIILLLIALYVFITWLFNCYELGHNVMVMR